MGVAVRGGLSVPCHGLFCIEGKTAFENMDRRTRARLSKKTSNVKFCCPGASFFFLKETEVAAFGGPTGGRLMRSVSCLKITAAHALTAFLGSWTLQPVDNILFAPFSFGCFLC